MKGSTRRVSVEAILLPAPLVRYRTAVETVSSAALAASAVLGVLIFSYLRKNAKLLD